MSKLDEVFAESETLENTDLPEEMPEHVTVSRPNMARSTVLSVRFNNDEYAQIQDHAEQKGIPMSTLVRAWAVERLRTQSAPDQRNSEPELADVKARLERVEQAVFTT